MVGPLGLVAHGGGFESGQGWTGEVARCARWIEGALVGDRDGGWGPEDQRGATVGRDRPQRGEYG